MIFIVFGVQLSSRTERNPRQISLFFLTDSKFSLFFINNPLHLLLFFQDNRLHQVIIPGPYLPRSSAMVSFLQIAHSSDASRRRFRSALPVHSSMHVHDVSRRDPAVHVSSQIRPRGRCNMPTLSLCSMLCVTFSERTTFLAIFLAMSETRVIFAA